MTDDVMTLAQVAELLQHPDPESAAGAQKVRRLVARGLPQVPGTRPALFLRGQVLEWLRAEAAAAAEAANDDDRPAATRRRRRRRAPAAGESPLAARARELRQGVGR